MIISTIKAEFTNFVPIAKLLQWIGYIIKELGYG